MSYKLGENVKLLSTGKIGTIVSVSETNPESIIVEFDHKMELLSTSEIEHSKYSFNLTSQDVIKELDEMLYDDKVASLVASEVGLKDSIVYAAKWIPSAGRVELTYESLDGTSKYASKKITLDTAAEILHKLKS